MNEWIQPVCTLVISVLVPFVVSLISTDSMSSGMKRLIAIIISLLAGLATALATGVPDASSLVAWVLAALGGTQAAYSLFKGVGVTSHLLDAVESVGNKDTDTDATKDANELSDGGGTDGPATK